MHFIRGLANSLFIRRCDRPSPKSASTISPVALAEINQHFEIAHDMSNNNRLPDTTEALIIAET
jgi:hypothetical protein